MNVYTIGKDIDQHWGWLEPLVTEVFDNHPSGWGAADSLEDIRAGGTLVLVIEDGDNHVVSLLSQQPDALHVTAAIGKGLDSWGGVAEQILTHVARQMGVSTITACVRKGWAKIETGRHGWTEHGVYIQRAV